ncbi:hypothetical protein [Sphingomonas sp. 3-13AW]|uniref:hypothetical protein n=1 Tax=Sphingomonas sp. 3-13AW TaxID=3050450 RepID=UPI003BB81475
MLRPEHGGEAAGGITDLARMRRQQLPVIVPQAGYGVGKRTNILRRRSWHHFIPHGQTF